MRELNRAQILTMAAVALGVLVVAGGLVALLGFSRGDDEPQADGAAVATPVSPTPQPSRSAEPATEPPSATATPAASGTPLAGSLTPGPGAGPSTLRGNAAVTGLSLPAASVSGSSPIEVRDTYIDGGGERFQDPSHPSRIAYYQRFGVPGTAGTNALFAAHINYVNYGNGPFAHLTSVPVGSSLSLTLATGQVLSYTVSSVQVVPLTQLDMNQVVFPSLPAGTERVTLISCGGTFVPNPSGIGGEYESRVILTADRTIT